MNASAENRKPIRKKSRAAIIYTALIAVMSVIFVAAAAVAVALYVPKIRDALGGIEPIKRALDEAKPYGYAAYVAAAVSAALVVLFSVLCASKVKSVRAEENEILRVYARKCAIAEAAVWSEEEDERGTAGAFDIYADPGEPGKAI